MKSVKKGDLITLQGGKRVLAISDSRYARNGKTKFECIHVGDLARLKAGDSKGRRTATVTAADHQFDVTGKGKMKDVELALNTRAEVMDHNQELAQKRLVLINYDHDKGGYGVTMRDGNVAYIGDTVLVEFTNGNYPGTIKRVAGNSKGTVGIVFQGKSKARGIIPKYIIKKV